jgi:hypothetical protein
MTAEAIESRKLDIGQVLGGTFQVIGRNLITFTVLGFLLSGLPSGILGFIQASWLAGQMENLSAATVFSSAYFTNLGYGVLVALITTAILQGALIYATVQDMNGAKASVGDALATGLRNFLPLLVVSILFGLAIVCGMILLIVPGIMIACAWCVAVPSLVAERTGIFDSFGRAAELTRGHRWRIFGLFVLLWVIFLVLGMIVSSITAAAVFTTPGALTNPMALATHPISIGLQVIQQTITAVISASLVAVLYVELRKLRDGAGPQWLAEIFS